MLQPEVIEEGINNVMKNSHPELFHELDFSRADNPERGFVHLYIYGYKCEHIDLTSIMMTMFRMFNLDMVAFEHEHTEQGEDRFYIAGSMYL